VEGGGSSDEEGEVHAEWGSGEDEEQAAVSGMGAVAAGGRGAGSAAVHAEWGSGEDEEQAAVSGMGAVATMPGRNSRFEVVHAASHHVPGHAGAFLFFSHMAGLLYGSS